MGFTWNSPHRLRILEFSMVKDPSWQDGMSTTFNVVVKVVNMGSDVTFFLQLDSSRMFKALGQVELAWLELRPPPSRAMHWLGV